MPNAVHSFFADIVSFPIVSSTNAALPMACKRFRKARASSNVQASGTVVACVNPQPAYLVDNGIYLPPFCNCASEITCSASS